MLSLQASLHCVSLDVALGFRTQYFVALNLCGVWFSWYWASKLRDVGSLNITPETKKNNKINRNFFINLKFDSIIGAGFKSPTLQGSVKQKEIDNLLKNGNTDQINEFYRELNTKQIELAESYRKEEYNKFKKQSLEAGKTEQEVDDILNITNQILKNLAIHNNKTIGYVLQKLADCLML